jgi:hypothetical protein
MIRSVIGHVHGRTAMTHTGANATVGLNPARSCYPVAQQQLGAEKRVVKEVLRPAFLPRSAMSPTSPMTAFVHADG